MPQSQTKVAISNAIRCFSIKHCTDSKPTCSNLSVLPWYMPIVLGMPNRSPANLRPTAWFPQLSAWDTYEIGGAIVPKIDAKLQ